MELQRNKTLTTIALVLTLSLAALMASLPLTTAHDPGVEQTTYAYIVVSPNPIGVDQTAFIMMWIDKVPPSAAGIGGERWEGFTIDVTTPGGVTTTLGPYTSDATSSTFELFTPTEIGEYTFVFSFPGQVADLYGPTGLPGSPSVYDGDTFLPSTTTTILTVQAEAVVSPPTYALPTEYWTRPIEGQNTAWAAIASNYLRGSSIVDFYQPNGAAPASAHIMWTKPLQDGGIAGGTWGDWGPQAYYTGLSYEGKFSNPLIMYGRLYYDAPLGNNGASGPYMCVDLATGETLWTRDDISPSFGQLYFYDSMNQHGVIGDGYLWSTSGWGAQTWYAVDPRTGEDLFTMTGVPSGYGGGFFGGYGSGIYTSTGEINVYEVDTQNNELRCWTSAALPSSPLVLTPGTGTNAYQYRPIGKEVDMSQNYLWNSTLAALPPGSSVQRVIPDDMILLATATTPPGGFFGFGTQAYTVTAISLKEATRGTQLWQKTYQPPANNLTKGFGPIDPVTRRFTMTDKETMQWSAYDLDSGNLVWGPKGDFRAFQYYGIVSHPPAPGYVAYGNLYVGGYGGEIHCFDLATGNVEWVYDNTFSGTETPWGNYPLYINGIADGKVYAYTSEHSPNTPLYKGSKIRCIDAYEGTEIWTLDGWYAIGSFGEQSMPIADGYAVYLNVYDMQIYCIGKGPSATSVTAPDTAVPKGTKILIEGTVTDQSPGAKDTPCVSTQSMGDWMAYIYMQKPAPMDATGVTVKLEAFGADDSYTEIGEVTSGTSGFACEWTPSSEGLYTILASFNGDDSYYSSYASTHVLVGPEPEEFPTIPTCPTAPTAAEVAQKVLDSLPASPTAQDIAQETINQLPAYPEAPAYSTMELVIIALVVVAIIIGLYAIIKKQK